MVIIDEAMLRKRAEHNDKNLSNLEEVSLHQSNIEGISRCLGNLCPLLKILYLQNNLIPRLENLKRLKSLVYLNVAVNNICYIEGLDRNENLNKLDFTVNFIDVDGLLTIARLKHNFALRELYLTGNPCTQWEHYRAYVIAQLPQVTCAAAALASPPPTPPPPPPPLSSSSSSSSSQLSQVTKLDGKDVTPSEKIAAQQRLQDMHLELRTLAAARIQQRSNEAGGTKVVAMPTDDEIIDGEVFTARALAAAEDDSSDEETAEELQERAQQKVKWTPEQRLLSYQEDERRRLKKERKEQRQREARDPSIQQKRDAEAARAQALSEEERTGRVKNRNEGHWEFTFEDDRRGSIIASIFFPKFLDTSSIDVDVHPTWFRCRPVAQQTWRQTRNP
jgi:protein TilB